MTRKAKQPPQFDPCEPQTVGEICYVRIIQDSKGKLSIDEVSANPGLGIYDMPDSYDHERKDRDFVDWWVVEVDLTLQVARPKPLRIVAELQAASA